MDNTAEVRPARRPLGVLLISVYYFFTSAYTLISFTLARSGVVQLDPVSRAYYASVSPADFVLLVLSALLIICAAISLLWLRQIAFPLFCAALALTASINLWHILTRHWVPAARVESVTRAALGWAVMLGVCIYAARLRAQGVLK